jgi:hypothetical protein
MTAWAGRQNLAALAAPQAYTLSSLNTGSLSGANNVSYTVSTTSPSTAYNAAQLIHNPTN